MKEYNTNGNNKVYSPNNILMFLTSHKRTNWYLKRDIAEIIETHDDNSVSIRLKFEPNGLGHYDDEYFLTNKDNMCVCCGLEDVEILTKHHIVPYIYKKFFPLELKNRNSYDIAMMCEDHHYQYEETANILKNEIVKIYDVPTIHECCSCDIFLSKSKGLAWTILQHKHKIPHERLMLMFDQFEKYTGLKASNKNFDVIINKKYGHSDTDLLHGRLVVEKLKTEEDFQNFIVMWRKHFIENAKPKFMNEKWTVDKVLKIYK